MRQRTATAALLAVLLAPVLATVGIGTQYTNLLGTVLVWIFCGLMAPDVTASLRRHRDALLPRVLLAGGALCLVGWTLTGRPWITESRFWLYLGIVALVPAFAAWLSWTRRSGLRTLVLAKAAVTLVAVVLVASALIESPHPDSLPIYRNVRHLNYDVALLLVVLAHLVQVVQRRLVVAGLMTLIAALGWFSVWSGARAQLVALVVMAGVLILSGAIRWSRPRVWLVPGALGLGLLGVVVGGGSNLLARQVKRSVTDDPDAITSGRLQLWQESVTQLDGVTALLFGRGPDAFDRLRLGPPSMHGADQRIVQPHNAVVQWLLEFGIVGTVLIVGLCCWLLVRAARTAARKGLPPERRLAAAMLIGVLAYAQFDGLFYHVVPFTVTAMLAAMTLFPLDVAGPDTTAAEPRDQAQASNVRVLATSSAIAANRSSTESNRIMPRSRSTNSMSTSTS